MNETTTPKRIRLSRQRGWRLPEGTINVTRAGPLGNLFVVGKDGTREECVHYFALMVAGLLPLSCSPSIDEMRAYIEVLDRMLPDIKGHDVACWCALDGKPCHGDVILALANEEHRPGMLDRFVLEDRGPRALVDIA